MVFSLNNLEKHQKNEFIKYRSEKVETSYSYAQAIDATRIIMRVFQEAEVPFYIGIAIKLEDHSPASCILILAILNHNCFFCPIPAQEAATFNSTSVGPLAQGCKYIVTEKAAPANSAYKAVRTLSIFNMHFVLSVAVTVVSSVESSANFRILYAITTSGTTGRGKQIFVPYDSIMPNIEALSRRLEITPADLIHLYTPLTFDPFVVEFFLPMSVGASLLITPPQYRRMTAQRYRLLFSAPETGRNAVSLLQITPSNFRLFGDLAIQQIFNSSSLRILLLGGEAFPSHQQMRSWQAPASCTRVFNIYGITEVSCWSTLSEWTAAKPVVDEAFIGEPLDVGTLLRVVDEQGQPLTGNATGELQIGSSIRKCFIPALDVDLAAVNTAGLLFRSSGDVVQRRGRHYKLLGRTNNTIKRFGVRVSLDELAIKIRQLLHNDQVNCLWQMDAGLLVVFVVLKENGDNSCGGLSCRQIGKTMAQLLPQERPDRIIRLRQMPLTPHGKCDTRSLADYCDDALASGEQPSSVSHMNVLYTFLKEIFGTHLPAIADLHLSQSFRKLGGSSFQAMRLVNDIGCWLVHPNDKGTLFAMLLCPQTQIGDIVTFLQRVEVAKGPGKAEAAVATTAHAHSISGRMHLEWRLDMGKCIDSAPAIRGSCICVGSHSHLLLTVDALTGAERARLELPDRIECCVEFISDCVALVGCYDSHVYAFNFQTGAQLWSVHVGGIVKAKPLLHSNTCIVGCYGGDYNLLCISLQSQQVLWRLRVGGGAICAAPTKLKSQGEMVLICTLDGTYAIVDCQHGTVVWEERLSSPIFSTPAIMSTGNCEAGIFAIAEVIGSVHVGNLADGVIIDSFALPGNIFSGILAYPSAAHCDSVSLLVGCYDKSVYCLNVDEHSQMRLMWRVELDAPVYARPTLLQSDDAYVASISTKGLIQILDIATGCVRAVYNVNAEVYSTPCSTAQNRIFFGCRNNALYSLRLETSG